MSMSIKKRIALGAGALATVGAVGTLVAGVTFGLFSATPITSGTNSFTAGTVAVSTTTPASVTCSVTAGTQPTNMVPGDSSVGAPLGSKADQTCTYNVKYTGSAPAYLAVDATVANGTPALYDGSNNGVQFYLKDGSATYASSTATNGQTAGGGGTTFAQEGGTPASLPVGTTSNLLVSRTAATTGGTVSFSLDYLLPLSSGNTYQGGSSTVTLTFHAVQSGNQTLPADCAAGQQCNASGTFAWS